MKERNPICYMRFRKSLVASPAIALLLCVLSASPLPAQFAIRPVNLAYLSQRADIILQGRVTNVSRKTLPGYPNIPIVEVTLQVERSLRGLTGKTYTFRELYLGMRSNRGKNAYKIGQRLFMFLPTPSQYGLSSPVGIGQGRFHIALDAKGGTRLANEQGNAGIFRDVERDFARSGKRLTSGQRRLASTTRGPVPLDEFVSLVNSLMTLPRIR